MTIGAGDGDMSACQWETRQIVIKACRAPGRCGVTLSAFGRKSRGNVIGVIRRGEICLVAGNTRRIRPGKSRCMATVAGYTGVSAR